MSRSYFTKRLRFWVRQALFAGLLVVGLYFINDSATPELYQLLIAFGLLGLLLYYFLGGGGSRGDGWKNEEDHEIDWVVRGFHGPRNPLKLQTLRINFIYFSPSSL